MPLQTLPAPPRGLDLRLLIDERGDRRRDGWDF
jgi:hypothetical protein